MFIGYHFAHPTETAQWWIIFLLTVQNRLLLYMSKLTSTHRLHRGHVSREVQMGNMACVRGKVRAGGVN